jgi:hypothetical protein
MLPTAVFSRFEWVTIGEESIVTEMVFCHFRKARYGGPA